MKQLLIFIFCCSNTCLYAQFKVTMNPDDTTERFSNAPSGIQFVLPIGHTSAILSTAFSPDGKRLITGSADNTAKIWDINTGYELHTLSGHRGPIQSVKYSPDGTKLVTASWDQTVAIWDAETFKFIRVLKGHRDFVTVAEFSPDSKKIISASQDSTAKVWDSETGRLLYTLTGHTGPVRSAGFSHDGRWMVTTSADKTARLWETATGKLLFDFNEHTGNSSTYYFKALFTPDDKTLVTVVDGTLRSWDPETGKLKNSIPVDSNGIASVSFSPDGRKIATTSADKILRIWDARSDSLLLSFPQVNYDHWLANFSPDGTRILTNSTDGSIYIWDVRTGKLFFRIKAHTRIVFCAEFSKDGRKIVTGSVDNTAKVWDAVTGQKLSEFKGNANEIYLPLFSPDGTKIVMASRDKFVKIWDIGKGDFSIDLVGHTSGTRSVVFSPDGTQILTGSYDKTAKLWNTSDGRLLKDFKGHQGSVLAAFSPDGNRIVTASSDKTARIWDVQSGNMLHELKGHTHGLWGASFSPDGTRIVTASGDSTARIWNAATGESIFILKGHKGPVQSALFSPNGKMIVTAPENDYIARVWDAATGKLLDTIQSDYPLSKASFTPDSKRIISLSDSGLARIWDAASGKLLIELKERKDEGAVSTDLSPDGKKIVTTSDDVAIWDLATGKEIRKFYKTNTLVAFARFHPDSKKIVTTSWENMARVWNSDSGALLYSFFAMDSGDYFMQLPSNYYFSTPDAARKIHYVTDDLKVITFEQLDVKYNRPDKVLEAIGSKDTLLIRSYKKAYEKRIKKLGVDTSFFGSDFGLPEADFVNRDDIAFEGKEASLKLHIKGKDSAYRLDRFNIWVNEVPVFGQRGVSLRKMNSHSLDTIVMINLSQGENKMETSVTNVNGTESYRMPLTVHLGPDNLGTTHPARKEKTWFIGIGIDKFLDNKYDLQYSAKDIRDLSWKLKEKYGDRLIIDTLFNENVTVRNVKALKKELQQTTEDDKVIIAYSGHGLLSRDFDYYLSTYSVNFEHPEKNGLPYDELEDLLDSIPARKKLMLIDACHSGEVDKDELVTINLTSDSMNLKKGVRPVRYKQDAKHLGLKNSFELMQSLFVNVGKNTGATIISAAAGTQFALERGDLKNGVFTYSILEALNKYPTMKISELKRIVGERVVQLTNGLQRPTSRNEPIAVDWDLW